MDMHDWEARLAATWQSLNGRDEADFRAAIDALVGELPPDDPVGPYERGSAFDSTGHPDLAVEQYRLALKNGLAGNRRRQAVIQLASSLRNIGAAEESVALLTQELLRDETHLQDEVHAFLALALTSTGREREAVALALVALAPHLKRYTRSVKAYASELNEAS